MTKTAGRGRSLQAQERESAGQHKSSSCVGHAVRISACVWLGSFIASRTPGDTLRPAVAARLYGTGVKLL